MPPKAGGKKKSKAAKSVTNKRRRGFIDPDLKVSKKQQKKDDAKFVRAKFGNFFDGREEDRKNRRAAAAELGLAYEYRFTGFGGLPAWVAASVPAGMPAKGD